MKMTSKVLRLLPIALLCIPVSASAEVVLYSTTPLSNAGTGGNISTYNMTESFVLASASVVSSIDFGIWLTAGDSLNTINYCISSATFCGGTSYGSGASAPVTTSYLQTETLLGYDAKFATGSGISLAAGTYYLTLSNPGNLLAAQGKAVLWDFADDPGSSTARRIANGTSGAGTSNTPMTLAVNGTGPTPEPATWLLGIAGLACMARLGRRRSAAQMLH